MRRDRRLAKADARCAQEWMRRAEGRQQATLGGRHGRRLVARVMLVSEARRFGIEPKTGEFTKALRYRLRVYLSPPRVAGSRRWLEEMTGGKVAPSTATGEVVITMPAGTSPERLAEVEALCVEHVPAHVVAVVRLEGAA
jgi:hypothetical protein